MAPKSMLSLAHATLLLVAACSLLGPGAAADSKLVRVALGKQISMQSGELGQPVTSYHANASFGTPPKPFKLLIDINAREIWIPHYLKLGVIYSRLNYKNGYAKADSKTGVKEPNDIYKIDYRGCELSGKAYRDVFELNNITESMQPVRYEQRFLAISSASNDKFGRWAGVDGVLPLNPWPISETVSDLISVSLSRAKLTQELQFALSLDQDLETTHGGELAFGGPNPAKFLGNLKYHHVVSQYSWELNLQKVMLGAVTIGECPGVGQVSGPPCTALLTTTSNDIYGPTKAIQAVLKLLGFAGVEENFKANSLYEIDCLKVATAPTLTFVIDGAYYILPPMSYIRKKIDGFIFKSSTCYVALLSNGSTNKWELGTNFLGNYYSVFDIERRQVALGARK